MSDRLPGRGRRQKRPSRWRVRQAEQREQQRVVWGGPVDADRVLLFSDAVFAIAITLLTLELQVRPGLHGSAFATGLRDLLPSLGAYALSFIILGQLWLTHHRIFSVIARIDYPILTGKQTGLGWYGPVFAPTRRPSQGHLD